MALIIEVVEAGLQVVVVSEVAWDREFRGLAGILVLLPLMVGQLFRLERETMAEEALYLGIVGVVVGRLDQLRVLPLELEVVELVGEAAVRVVQGDGRLVGSGHGSALFEVEVPVFFVKFRARVAVDWLKAGRLVGRSVLVTLDFRLCRRGHFFGHGWLSHGARVRVAILRVPCLLAVVLVSFLRRGSLLLLKLVFLDGWLQRKGLGLGLLGSALVLVFVVLLDVGHPGL